jgi:glycosyltransferase involved in cell wall biosynthesis
MRVVVSVFEPVRADGRAAREARALSQAGHEVVLVAPAADEPMRPIGSKVALQIAGRAPGKGVLRPLRALWTWFAVLAALWRTDADVVHASGDAMLARAWLVARLRGRSLVYDLPSVPRHARRRALRERLFGRRAVALVAGSEHAAAAMRAGPDGAGQAVVVRDIPDIGPGGIPSAGLRRRLALDDAPFVLHDARCEAPGFERLVVALARIPEVRLVALSDPEEADALRLVAERHRVGTRVHVIGGVSPQRLAAFARDADAMACLPEPGDRMALDAATAVLHRSLLAGCPVVTTYELAGRPPGPGVLAVSTLDPGVLAETLDAALRGLAAPARIDAPRWEAEAGRLAGLYDRVGGAGTGRRRERPPLRDRLVAARAEVATIAAGGPGNLRATSVFANGRRLRAEGRLADAEQAFARAVELDDANDRHWYHWAASLRDLNRPDAAVEAYQRVVALNDAKPGPLVVTAAIAMARLGVRGEALEVLGRLDALSAPQPTELSWIAELHSSLGDVGPALDALERIPPNPAARAVELARLRVLEQSGELTDALAVANSLGDVPAQRRLEGSLRAFSPEWAPDGPEPRVDATPPSGNTVLHVIETALPHATSGYTYRTTTVLAAQRRAGLRPVAVTRLGFPATKGVYSHAPVELVDGVPHHYLTLPGVTRYTSIPVDERVRRNVELVAELVERVEPVALHGTSPHYNGLLGLALREAFGIPLVYEARGFPEMTWAVRPGGDRVETYGLRREAETRCMREADAVITLSEVMRRHIVGRGVPAERVFVVPHMVDTERFAPRPKDPALVDRYDLRGATVVGYVSSLVDYEGVDTLLRGIAAARRERLELRGLIVGDGLALPGLRDLAHELELDDVVRFTGRVPHAETIDHYALMDVFVVPRRGLEVCAHVTPLKPFEAMAMARCLVVSDLPALSETVGEGEHGRRFTPDDPESLAAVLAELAADPALREELGAAARRFVERHHSRALPPEVASAPIAYARDPLARVHG